MRRVAVPLVIVGCLVLLVLACYGRALVRGEQFAYRDAAHYYYPLYQRVQTEWNAGRLPLWEPEENGGMPLLGNPTAAVLYPGKVIYALFPYKVGARLYIVAHTLLAFAAMLALLRHWNVSWTGSGLGALSYAFGGPILFQYCNVIFLVGAAWLPLGFRAVDRWIRLGRRFALLELAVVLAMQVLGGDPETAYLTGLAAGGYALALAAGRRQEKVPTRAPVQTAGRGRGGLVAFLLVAVVVIWVAATLAAGVYAPRYRQHTIPPVILPWMRWVQPAVTAAWGLAALAVLSRWRKNAAAGRRTPLVAMLGGLAVAAVLAGAVAGAQLLPVFEFTGLTVRAANEGPHDVFPFSLPPTRIVEFFLPNVFGSFFYGNRSWLLGIPPLGKPVKTWVPTLYLGGLTAVLALAAARWRGRGAPWRVWITAVAAVSLLGALGEFTGPLCWGRYVPSIRAAAGPHDPMDTLPIRLDDKLRDGDGSVYWLMATVLPGFRQFRFPSKLLTFTALGIAALAGMGWDDITSGDPRARRRSVGWSVLVLLASCAALGAAVPWREAFLVWLWTRPLESSFGPFDAEGAYRETLLGVGHGAAVLAAALVLFVAARRRPALAGVLALAITAADLALANAGIVMTADQKLFETTPEVLAEILKAEAKNPSRGPFRVHRVPIWNPTVWRQIASDDRLSEFAVWERDTLQPKHGINEGVAFTVTLGVAELFDYEFFFSGFRWKVDAEMARALKITAGDSITYYPRRGFNMWNSRYFVLPYAPRWDDEWRGFASFLDRAERIQPPPDAFNGPGGNDRELAWARDHDYQLLRNLDAFPRSWIVHSARFLPPIAGLDRADRKAPMEEILFANDSIWNDSTRPVYDPAQIAWLESDDRIALAPYVQGTRRTPAEEVTVVAHESDRVELDARLDTPGVVLLSEVFYPGWTLTIDGKPAPVYRANRMMRGAAVESGRHRLVYTFRPRIVRIGLALSCVGLAVTAALALLFLVRPLSPTLAPPPVPAQDVDLARGDTP